MNFIRNLAVLVFCAIVIIGGYGFYRYSISPHSVNISQIVDVNSVGVPTQPVICSAAWSQFDAAGKLTLYAENGEYRLDVSEVREGKPITFHVVGSLTVPPYAWSTDNAQKITAGDIALPASIQVIPCSPWWFPDSRVFVSPQSTT